MEEEIKQEGTPLAKIDTIKIPASEAKPSPESVNKEVYPKFEEMTFRGIIRSEEEGYALLRAVQILVNELGPDSIIKVVAAVEKKPQLLAQAKAFLPYIGSL